MITKVKVCDIRANPFQPRKEFDDESIDKLAKEIEKIGLWVGSLRGRKRGNKLELCFGHRRLEAIKRLGWQEIEIEIADLTDEEMALQALVENLQRQGLNDADKGDAIVAYVKLRKLSCNFPIRIGKIKDDISKLLGLSVSRVEQLMEIATFEEKVKERIRSREVAGSTVVEALSIADNAEDFVELVGTAANEEISAHKMKKIGKRLREIPDRDLRTKVKQKVVKGELTEPDEVTREVAKELRKQAREKQPKGPPDLILVIGNWTEEIRQWNEQLDQVIPYASYIDNVPKIAEKFRSAVRELQTRLEKFL